MTPRCNQGSTDTPLGDLQRSEFLIFYIHAEYLEYPRQPRGKYQESNYLLRYPHPPKGSVYNQTNNHSDTYRTVRHQKDPGVLAPGLRFGNVKNSGRKGKICLVFFPCAVRVHGVWGVDWETVKRTKKTENWEFFQKKQGYVSHPNQDMNCVHVARAIHMRVSKL